MTPHRLLRRALAPLVVACVLGLAGGPAFADTPASTVPPGPSNSATAVNTTNGSSVFDLAFSVRQIASGAVVPDNSAVAYASCTSCETVAIAIQLVFVTSPSNDVAPTNAAVAVNYLCNLCQTFAAAVQYVVNVPGPVHFNDLGRDQLKLIRDELRDLNEARPAVSVVQSVLDTIKAQLATLVTSGLESGGDPHDHQDQRATADASTTTSVVDRAGLSTTTTTQPGSESPTSTTTTSPAASATTSAPASSTTVAP